MTTATEELVVTVTPRNRANFRRLKTNSIQSVKRWEKENELLYAMMEDESEWLAKLFPDVVISPEFFFYALEDGSLLCRLANYIQEKAELYSQRHHIPVPGKKFRYHTMSKCGKEIKLFRSRENVQQFLTWCRSHGIPEAILFESNDVVQVDDYREGCRGVIICLMEIVRRTAKFELDELPQLIQMEKEIEEDEAQSDTEISNGQGQVLDVEKINMSEIDNLEVQTDPPEIQSPSSIDSDSGVDSVFDQEEGDNTASRLTEFSQEETEKTEIITTTLTRKQNLLKPKDQKSSPKKTKELPSLLESTGPKSELDKQICKLAQNYNIKLVHRLKEGKYIILGRIMFVRMLNDHMLVRIGGGWDTLEHYLMTHAPSKEALESPSTPSSQAVTSPRNSISASSGARTSLIEKIKKKEQVGVVNRDSPVYSSQGSLHQQLGNQSSPKIKDRGKRSSLTNKDEKDITEAIRKISTSVSQTLADRPASFTAKTFSLLKSRFDKGIFGTSRRTSSPDLTQKGSKIRRRSSDTTTMADVATTLAFDGEQVSVANNNDTVEKQPEPGDTEETGVGKGSTSIGDLLGDESLPTDISPPEHPASDDTGSSVPVGDLLSSEQSRLEDSLEAQQNGNTNLIDISSFDPFPSVPDQGELISIDTASSEKHEEQPKSTDFVDNGELAHEEELPEAVTETTVESSPPVDLGDLLQDTETKPDFESTVEASPRPIGLGDLLQDSQTTAEAEGTVEPLPPVTPEETVAPEEPVQETEAADVELVKPDEPGIIEDVPTSIQEAPPFVVEPTPEIKPEPPKVEEELLKDEELAPSEEAVVEPSEPLKVEDESVKTDELPTSGESVVQQPEPPKLEVEPVKHEEPAPSEETVVELPELSEPPKVEDESVKTDEPATSEETVVQQPEPPKLEVEPVKDEEPAPNEETVLELPELSKPPNVEDESGKTEEPTTSEETVVQQPEPPKLEVEPAQVKETPSDEAVIKSEGESTEAAPVLNETTTQEQSQTQQAAVVQMIESAPVKADESKEGAKPVDDQPPKAEKPAEKASKSKLTEKPADKATKAKPAATGAREKSPPKPTSVAKKPTGAAKPTSPTKGPTAAAAKKDVKAPATKAPATRPASAKAPAAKTPAAKAPTTKAPATKTAAPKTSTSAAAGAKKPAGKPGETKADEAKKLEKPKSAAATRPSTKAAARPASAVDKKVPASTSKPAASKAPGKDVKDAGPPKSAPKTTTTRPPSAKPAPKTTAPGAKSASAKPTRTQSAKPADSVDGTGPSKKPAARPTSAKPKTTTTTVKKTTTTTVTKSGTAAPAKTHTTTTKTVTQAKTGQPKTTTTTSTTTKTTAKPSAPRPALAAKKTADAKPAGAGTKSKIGGKPSAGGKPAAKEKQVKQEEKPPVSQPEAATTTDKKPTEVVETKPDEKLTEKVETCSEEKPVDQLTELTPDLAPAEQAFVPVEVSSEFVEESGVVTRIVTTKTTTIIQDGEEESTTTTEESTFEQGES